VVLNVKVLYRDFSIITLSDSEILFLMNEYSKLAITGASYKIYSVRPIVVLQLMQRFGLF
jgi:hypothetical protein